jgi:hypothetical protein
VCAFRRGEDVVVAVGVRRGAGRVRLPPGTWRDLLTGAVRSGEVELGEPPIALLVSESSAL